MVRKDWALPNRKAIKYQDVEAMKNIMSFKLKHITMLSWGLYREAVVIKIG